MQDKRKCLHQNTTATFRKPSGSPKILNLINHLHKFEINAHVYSVGLNKMFTDMVRAFNKTINKILLNEPSIIQIYDHENERDKIWIQTI